MGPETLNKSDCVDINTEKYPLSSVFEDCLILPVSIKPQAKLTAGPHIVRRINGMTTTPILSLSGARPALTMYNMKIITIVKQAASTFHLR